MKLDKQHLKESERNASPIPKPREKGLRTKQKKSDDERPSRRAFGFMGIALEQHFGFGDGL